jgi:predicted Zn-dependent protease
MSIILKISALFLTLILSSCLSSIDNGLMKVANSISDIDPVTGKRELSFESQQKEIANANTNAKKIMADFKKKGLKTDYQLSQFVRVKKVFDRVVKVSHRQNLPWEIHLIDDDTWNAFTIGGGKVFVYNGIFKGKAAIQSDDELAAILAHEIAHITARHTSENQGKLLVSNLIDKNTKSDIYKASFTTIHENEADKFSVIYSALAGYNPKAGVKIWQKMHKHYGSKPNTLLYSHPLNNQRAKSLENYGNLAMKYYQKNQINPNYKKLLAKNDVFAFNTFTNKKAGSGGGALSVLEVLSNTYIESLKTKIEQQKRGL